MTNISLTQIQNLRWHTQPCSVVVERRDQRGVRKGKNGGEDGI